MQTIWCNNSSNSFLLLRAADIGFDSSNTISLYFIYNLTASLLAIPCGNLSDRVGRKRLLVSGYLTFSLVFFGFAFCITKPLMILIFVIYGVFTAMTAGVERAFIAEIAPPQLKGDDAGAALHPCRDCLAACKCNCWASVGWNRGL